MADASRDRNDLGDLDDDQEPQLRITAPDDDLRWSTLQEFLETEGNKLEVVVYDLKFGLLD
jgi:hypothetical protein